MTKTVKVSLFIQPGSCPTLFYRRKNNNFSTYVITVTSMKVLQMCVTRDAAKDDIMLEIEYFKTSKSCKRFILVSIQR